MNLWELHMYLFNSNFFNRWHWFSSHFAQPFINPLSNFVLQACLDCEQHIPGFTKKMIDALASISGKEKYEPHYEQLLQRLAELHVIQQVIKFDWTTETSFRWEPTPVSGGKKNPEIIVENKDYQIGVEVKAPSILNHIRQRSSNFLQFPARIFSKEIIEKLPGAEMGVTFPRDNPVKDFLISAEKKFAPFKKENENFSSILVIVWDDYFYEPISSLIHPFSGLFTSNSFAQEDGEPLKFPSVDGVIIIGHLHQLIRATRDEPLIPPCLHPLDYGQDEDYPMKVFIPNPFGAAVPELLLKCFQAHPPSPVVAEYAPTDWIWWFKV
ncbi:hypothetical protein [Anabaena azotica]|uniref:hypothetical protein n=1 Tax=Anabaena azotica TaxID=197653 RepID=UPI0039A641D1